jgi:lipopolysaccharide transport system ATP-binding protein
MTTSNISIDVQNVSKKYNIYKSKAHQLFDLLGFKLKSKPEEYFAIKNINFSVKKGERLAIIGRNGAGKTTLLKLLTGNFAPSTGKVVVNGKVQALMTVGVGFHPEFSGLENIQAALAYNGLTKKEVELAIADIIDFVELGDFIHQPVKTYSLGMQSRLFFATATAVKPEILIIDEVLGAGDAYFSAKSAERMKNLTSNGCTLLLVSHSTSQVLQFCDSAIWMESGEVVKQGPALEIVKSYEAYSKRLEFEYFNRETSAKTEIIQSKWLREKLLKEVLSAEILDSIKVTQKSDASQVEEDIKSVEPAISRWPSHDERLKIKQIRLLNSEARVSYVFNTQEKMEVEITIEASESDIYGCIFAIVLFTEDGKMLTRHCSPKANYKMDKGKNLVVSLFYEELLLGNGKYIFSAAIYKQLDLFDLSSALYYDLLSRSFEFQVISQHSDDSSLFHPPCQWNLINTHVGSEKHVEKV